MSIILIQIADSARLFSNVGYGPVKARFLIGYVEVTIVSEPVAPAVSYEPCTVLGGTTAGVKVVYAVIIIPADDGNRMICTRIFTEIGSATV